MWPLWPRGRHPPLGGPRRRSNPGSSPCDAARRAGKRPRPPRARQPRQAPPDTPTSCHPLGRSAQSPSPRPPREKRPRRLTGAQLLSSATIVALKTAHLVMRRVTILRQIQPSGDLPQRAPQDRVEVLLGLVHFGLHLCPRSSGEVPQL